MPQPKDLTPTNAEIRPWERTHPACPVSDTQSTLEACAPRTAQRSRNQKLGASSRLRAFVVKPAPNPPRRHEDAKNHAAFSISRKILLVVLLSSGSTLSAA